MAAYRAHSAPQTTPRRLCAANDRAERKLYDTLTLSLDGGRVRAANGIDLAADLAPEFAPKLDGIF
ncbi:hypothetical protein LH422_15780, partial [Laribacter hongkongensis]|nr:hypothetical protein [Laribacter hongkongensis]